MKTYNYKILYAEDDEQTRLNYFELLNLFFTEVYIAKDGEEALALFLKHRPQIVLLDINMPKLDGLTVAQKIKEIDQDIKIVMLTAYSQKEQLLKAIKIQVYDYLVKPVRVIDLEKLLLEIVKQLDNVNYHTNTIVIQEIIKWDKNNNLLYKNEELIKLTKKEILLLKLLCSDVNRIFETAYILNYVWEDELDKEFDTKPLRTLISRIKSKLGIQIIESIYNIGYTLKI